MKPQITDSIRLGISTCPNDTFAFHAILGNRIEMEGIRFEVELLDIEELNQGLANDRFDVAKASFCAAAALGHEYWVLPSGSALGFGVGPLLLSSNENSNPENNQQTTLCPGEQTTAHLLLRKFYGNRTRVKQVLFSEIMPALRRKQADFGVCIHEGRFTWHEQGLYLVADLGERWEHETGTPLPLGGILASRKLGSDVLTRVQNAIRSSIEYALANPVETLPTMRKHAQEFDDQVLMQHVDLYVNEWTVDLGSTGQQALQLLAEAAEETGLTKRGRLELFG